MSEAMNSAAAEPEGRPPGERRVRSVGRPRQGVAITIGQALQAHYDDLVAAPMPDRFLVLLAELEAREMKRG